MSDSNTKKKTESKRFLVFYIIALFAVALVLILLSYVSQVRADRELAGLSNQLQMTTSELEEQTSAALGAQSRLLVLQETVSEQERLIRELEATIQNQQGIMAQIYEDLQLEEHITTDEAMVILARSEERRVGKE